MDADEDREPEIGELRYGKCEDCGQPHPAWVPCEAEVRRLRHELAEEEGAHVLAAEVRPECTGCTTARDLGLDEYGDKVAHVRPGCPVHDAPPER